MVDLDSNPTKLIEIVEVGKQHLITRGALTTFSIANDVAKYFAILPAMFAFTYATQPGERGPLNALNVMHLGTPKSAIISAIIFNALIILRSSRSRSGASVPRDRRDRAAAPQPADLRARRRDPALHRDQADRPRRPQPVRRVTSGVRGQLPDPARDGRGSRQDLPDAPGGPAGAAEGRDVVIGYLEPHDRPETAALADGLEVVPRLRRARRPRARGDGRRRRDRARARARAGRRARPHECARDAQREALRRTSTRCSTAGIDVISTVNVQHLESLNDAIFELTACASARRSRTGSSTRPTRSCSSTSRPRSCRSGCAPARSTRRSASRSRSQNFFRHENLSPCASSCCARSPRTSRRGGSRRRSSRSASRRSPSACSRWSSRSRSRSGSSAAPGARPSASAPRSTRSGCAGPGSEPTPEEQTQLAALRRLASILGVHFLEEDGDDLVDDGPPRRRASAAPPTSSSAPPTSRRRREIFGGSLLSRMVRELPGIDIRVVADRAAAGGARDEPLLVALAAWRAVALALVVGCGQRRPPRRPARGASSSRSRAAARADRARRGDPDRAGRGRDARAPPI